MIGTKHSALEVEPEAPIAQPVDQRTGQPMVTGSIPTPQLAEQQRKAQAEDAQRERAEVIAYLEETLAPQATYGDGSGGRIVDSRKLTRLIQTELDRLALMPDGMAAVLVSIRATRAAAKAPSAKALEKELAAQRETATSIARGLLAEMESRSAWIFANILANKANEQRLQDLVDELTVIESQYHLGIDIGRYVRLSGDCAALAGQRLQIVGRLAAAEYLPNLEKCPGLPEELQRPKSVAPSPHTDQRSHKAFDPNLPKDHEIRMAGGSTPRPRNADGTLADVYVAEAFGGPRHAPAPRTAAQERAALRKVAADIAAEDGADGKP